MDKENTFEYVSENYGKWISNPPSGEDVVITGLSGSWPSSNNIYDFQHNLYNKFDMVTNGGHRWNFDNPKLPKRSGKLNNIEKFDAGYFGIHHKQAHAMDPAFRMMLEKTTEAIIDAGYHPSELAGSKTGVFMCLIFSETEGFWYLNSKPQYSAITGCSKSMLSHRISYNLKLQGPSYNIDCACSSGLTALEHACKAIRNGECDRAIVGGANLLLNPLITLQFVQLGVLSSDGTSKSFDSKADGYVRSEGIGVIMVQKSNEARRIYAHVIHSKTNCDGFKQKGITFPSSEMHVRLFDEIYKESDTNIDDITYIECHGSGTRVGDSQEIPALDAAISKKRETPLLVGSVKSNMGHCEAAAGIAGLSKVIIMMENGAIPPNLHFSKSIEGMEALESGRIKVVDRCVLLSEEKNCLIGISSFGFSGSNAHTLLRWNQKKKNKSRLLIDDVPRLVCVSGRTLHAVTKILDDIKKRELDPEYCRLYHQVFNKVFQEHFYKGYSIVAKSGELERSVKTVGEALPLYLVFTKFGPGWSTIARELTKLPLFTATLDRVHDILIEKKIDIKKIIQDESNSNFHEIIGNAVLEIAISDLLKTLKLYPERVYGLGIGEFICDYFDGCLTLEETVNSVYYLALFSCYQNSACYSINISHSKLQLPLGVYISQIFDNGITVTGNPKKLKTFISVLSKQGAVVEEINGTKRQVSQIFSKISSKGSCSSQNFLDTNEKFSYLNKKLIKPYRVLEIGSQLKILEKFKYSEIKDLRSFLEILGSLFQNGYNCDLAKLYPEVQYPVSRGTPMISPLIEWNHTQDWFVAEELPEVVGSHIFSIDINDEDWKYLSDHVVDGRNIFPAIGYLYLVWEKFAQLLGATKSDMRIIFENLKFLRSTHISRDKPLKFSVMIQTGSGYFEVMEGGNVVATGKISAPQNFSQEQLDFQTSKDLSMLTSNDIYKELRLRGYNYRGEFCKIQQCSDDSSFGTVLWRNNWVTFIDNMLQLTIFYYENRIFCIPTHIKRISIDARKHLDLIETFGNDEAILPVYINKDSDTIRSGGIEVRGVERTPITRRKDRQVPILEKYHFIPNETTLSLRESLRVNLQIIFENCQTVRMKIVELAEEAADLVPIIQEILLEIPSVQTEVLSLLNERNLKSTFRKKKLDKDRKCYLVVGTNILGRSGVLYPALDYTNQSGYVLSRESFDFELTTLVDVEVLTTFFFDNEKLVLVRKHAKTIEASTLVKIEEISEFNWLSNLQICLNNHENVILYAQNYSENGILGFINCLRREPRNTKIKCVVINGDVPTFNPVDPFYEKQLKKGFAINIYQNSKWGTYRLLPLEPVEEILREHCQIDVINADDLSSLKWIEGPLTRNSQPKEGEQLIYVYYSALNFSDVTVVMRRLPANKLLFEFAGRSKNGKRFMGIVSGRGLSNMVMATNNLLWPIPDFWTMEEAATVPLIYATLIYALLMRTTIKKGNSILIHCGSGDIGQAAIILALHFGCIIYTTADTIEKRQFLKERFPQIKIERIGNSRDTSFEQMIQQETNGRGVDFVLNSLDDEKLAASVRCLAFAGNFLEIKNVDLVKNSELQLLLVKKAASFHSIVLDQFCSDLPLKSVDLKEIFTDLINIGAIQPITKIVYEAKEIENAFRFMTSRNCIGKILIKLREEEREKNCVPNGCFMKGKPRFFCNSNNIYVIIGGLGGMGLELADWLVLRGAKKIVLTSRKGIQTGYQSYRIKIWKNLGVTTRISTDDVTTREGCEKLIKETTEFGEIESIFNVAVALHDAIFENQDATTFRKSLAPKAVATKHLDEVTRKICPKLRDFVVFSSAICARGNAGQTNYGMANSIMEQICENRRKDGFPAVAIQWSAVGDVGIIAERPEAIVEILGTIPQPISSCLRVLDNFLKQNNPIVCSMVISERRQIDDIGDTLVEIAANILGIKQLKTVSWHSTFAELGLDSLTAEELKHTVEKDFKLFLTLKEIRNLTFSRIQELQDGLTTSNSTNEIPEEFEIFLKTMVSEPPSDLAVVKLRSKTIEMVGKPLVIFFPGIDGFGKTLEPLSINLKVKALSLQYCYGATTVTELAENLIPFVEELINKSERFNFISYSFGTIIALEVVNILEQKGYKGRLICIDGTPAMLKIRFKSQYLEPQFQSYLLTYLSNISGRNCSSIHDEILKNGTLEEKFDSIEQLFQEFSSKQWRRIFENLLKRLDFFKTYEASYTIQSHVTLCKATTDNFAELPQDYGLSELCKGSVKVVDFKGDHINILNQMELVAIIEASFGIES